LKKFLIVSELGLLLLDDRKLPVSKFAFSKDDRAKMFLDSSSGVISGGEMNWINENLKPGDIGISDLAILQALRGFISIELQPITDSDQREIRKNQLSLLVQSGMVSSVEEAEEAIRDVSVALSSLRIKEMSSNPDLQAMESVQALTRLTKLRIYLARGCVNGMVCIFRNSHL